MIRIVEASDTDYSDRMNNMYGGNLKFEVVTKSTNEDIQEITSNLEDGSKEWNDVMDSQINEIISAINRYCKDGMYDIEIDGKVETVTDSILESWEDDIQMLAIKDGIDFVKYSDGVYGFVAYYNGFSLDKNSIRYIPTKEE